MKTRKLNYRFHNPNSAAVTADYILKVFVEANQDKVHRAIQACAGVHPKDAAWKPSLEGHTV